jgi:hypothetical protein
MDILRPSAIADPIILHSRACIPEPETNMRAARVKFRVKFRLSNRRRFSICSLHRTSNRIGRRLTLG